MINIYIENGANGYIVNSVHIDEFDGTREVSFDLCKTLGEARRHARLRGELYYVQPFRIIEHIRPLTIPNSLMATKKKKKVVVKKVVKAKKK